MTFTIRYDDQVLRNAVNTFVRRRLTQGFGRLGLLSLLIAVAGFLVLVWQGDRSWLVGALGAAVLLIGAICFVLWRWHQALMRQRLDAIPSRRGTVTLTERDLTIAADSGSATLPWQAFSDIWKLDRCWLLFLTPNNFVTLPIDGAPKDALTFIAERIPASGGWREQISAPDSNS